MKTICFCDENAPSITAEDANRFDLQRARTRSFRMESPFDLLTLLAGT